MYSFQRFLLVNFLLLPLLLAGSWAMPVLDSHVNSTASIFKYCADCHHVNNSNQAIAQLEQVSIPGEGNIAITEWQWFQPKKVLLPGGSEQWKNWGLTPIKICFSGGFRLLWVYFG